MIFPRQTLKTPNEALDNRASLGVFRICVKLTLTVGRALLVTGSTTYEPGPPTADGAHDLDRGPSTPSSRRGHQFHVTVHSGSPLL
ncbi:hypothetical protein EVAR_7424_1 [Eumeta japonica]|uniref:Uncharacterized protein n=1 Tax=Eumeta variegata TaxID=151549 RepID=A0A4C1V6D9_EUMVA|nr:hypothetical protein EVAR_7424_1 [Eumeta japonica]